VGAVEEGDWLVPYAGGGGPAVDEEEEWGWGSVLEEVVEEKAV